MEELIPEKQQVSGDACPIGTDLTGYAGNVSVTNGGRTCQKWVSQTPHIHSTTSSQMPFNSSLEASENYCRSAYDDNIPWCFTTDQRVRWEYCDQRICGGTGDACQTGTNLYDYVGNVSVTNGDRACQKWTEQVPHTHTTTPAHLPFNTALEDVDNYCRSAWSDPIPWCFTTDPRVRWEYCDRQICEATSKECRNRLSDYVGDVSVTNGGRTCQKWISQLPHSHTTTNHDMPLNSTLEDVDNYCRSAGGDYVPWCFTKDPRLRWEYCDRRICGDQVCGGTLSDSTGWLTSLDADGDGFYDNDIDCLWELVAPENWRTEIQVISMDVEDHLICGSDFLEIYEQQPFHVSHGRYCGTVAPPLIRSRSDVLYVRFYADKYATGRGFIANYSLAEAHIINGSTESPEERYEYVAGTIVCPSDVDIGMYTGNISITNGGRSCLNWTDGVGALIKSDKNYCRNKIRSDQVDPTPWCFTSTYGEWQYCYEQICKGAPCGGVLTDSSGWFSAVDRDGDGFFDRKRDCLWTLLAPYNYQIEIHLLYLNIAQPPCYYEVLLIYAVERQPGAKILCGNSLTLPMTVNYQLNWMYVRFLSDNAGIAGPGFNLTYSHVGGGKENVANTNETKDTESMTPLIPSTSSADPLIQSTSSAGPLNRSTSSADPLIQSTSSAGPLNRSTSSADPLVRTISLDRTSLDTIGTRETTEAAESGCDETGRPGIVFLCVITVELQWLEHLWDHEN